MEETYTISPKVRYVVLGVGLLCLILAIWTGFKWHDADFDYLFGTMKYWQGFGLLAFILILGSSFMGGENRKGHIYLNGNGELDLTTPRRYERLDKPMLARFFGRSNSFMGTTIESFDYSDGCVTVENTKGRMISGPLSDLTFKYNVDNSKGIYFYQLTDSEGNKIKFYKNSAALEEKEWDDVAMILDNCGTVNEGKMSKFAGKATKIVEAVQNFDASDIVGSSVDAAQNATALCAKKDGYIAKTMYKKYKNEIENPDADEPFSKGEKIVLWVVGGIVGIYILIVLLINLVNFPAWHSDKADSDYEYADEAIETVDYDEETLMDDAAALTYDYNFEGSIGGRDVVMRLNIEELEVSGSYCYSQFAPDAWHKVSGTISRGGYMDLEDCDENGQVVGTFEIHFETDGSLVGEYIESIYDSGNKRYAVNLQEAQ